MPGCPQLWWVPHLREHGCPALPCLLHGCAWGAPRGQQQDGQCQPALLGAAPLAKLGEEHSESLVPACSLPCTHGQKQSVGSPPAPASAAGGAQSCSCLLGVRLGCWRAQPLHALKQGLLESCWHRAPEDSLSHHAGARTALILQLSPPLSACIPSPGHSPPEGSCCSPGLTAAWP